MKPIKDTLDPLKIYMNAERYRIADLHLRTTPTNLMNVVAPPSMVLSAFASELYLKCLLALEAAKVPPTHNLKALFRGLRLDTRRALETLWDQYAKTKESEWRQTEAIFNVVIRRDLKSALDVGGSGFVSLRYIHEQDQNNKSQFYIGELPQMLRQVILEKCPHWTSMRHTPPTSHSRSDQKPPATSAESEPGDNQ